MWLFFFYHNQIVQSQCDRLILTTGEGFRETGVIFVRFSPSLWLGCSCHSLARFVTTRFRSVFHSSSLTPLAKKTKNEEFIE
jgi:hypothetical protein